MPISRRRKLVFILTGLIALVLALVIGVALLASLFGGGTRVPANSVLVLRVGGTLPDNTASDPVANRFFGTPNESLTNLVLQLKKAKVDKRIGGVLMQIDAPLTVGWAKLDELRDAIADVRTTKPVYAHMELALNKEFYLATACDKIFVEPEGTLFTTGLAADVTFYKGSLDKLGVKAETFQIGKYKNYPDQFTRTEMSDAQREVVNAIIDDQFARFVSVVSQARRKSPEDVRLFIDNSPMTAARARDAGMIDGANHRDEIEEDLRKRLGYKDSEKRLRFIAGSSYRDVSPESLDLNTGERIAVIYAPGAIGSGESGGGPFSDESTGSDSLRRALRTAADDERIRAVVLRVDSPGGSSIASDIIYDAVEEVKAKKKPVVVSMADYAASGGYFISANADRIVAHPSTVTGSIGVFAGKPVVSGLYEWLGISNEYVLRGKNAGYFRETEDFTPDERARFESLLNDFYNNSFVPKVAKGRSKSPEYINSIAQGRVWTGAQARERGLVDEFGGLDRAIEIAKELANIPKEDSIRRVVLPAPRSLLQDLLGSNGDYAQAKARREQRAIVEQLPTEVHRALKHAALFSRIRRGETMAMLPFEMDVR